MEDIPEADAVICEIQNITVYALTTCEVRLVVTVDENTKISVLKHHRDSLGPTLIDLADSVNIVKDAVENEQLNDEQKRILLKFAIQRNIDELIIFLLKNGVSLNNQVMCRSILKKKKYMAAMIEGNSDRSKLTETVISLFDMTLIDNLQELGAFDDDVLLTKNFLETCVRTNVYTFLLKKYSKLNHNFDMSSVLKYAQHIEIFQKNFRLFVDEYGFDVRKNALNWWEIACDNYEEELIEMLLPYFIDDLPDINMPCFTYSHMLPSISTLNKILSLGANVQSVESAIKLGEKPDRLNNLALKLVVTADRIITERIFTFYRNRLVTADNSLELYNECEEIVKRAINIEIEPTTDLADYFDALHLQYVNVGVGFYITTISKNKIQLVDAIDNHIFSENISSVSSRQCDIHEQVLDALKSLDLTQDMKTYLFIHCLIGNFPKTAILLSRNGADTNVNLKYKFLYAFPILNSIEVVDILLETDTNLKPILKTAVKYEYTDTVEHIFLNYADRLRPDMTRHKGLIQQRNTMDKLIAFFTEPHRKYDINEIVRPKYFFFHSYSGESGEIFDNFRYLLDLGLDCDIPSMLDKNTGFDFNIISIYLPYQLARHGKQKVCSDILLILDYLHKLFKENLPLYLKGFDRMFETFFSLDVCDKETMRKILYYHEDSDKWKVFFQPIMYVFTTAKHRVDALLKKYAEEILD